MRWIFQSFPVPEAISISNIMPSSFSTIADERPDHRVDIDSNGSNEVREVEDSEGGRTCKLTSHPHLDHFEDLPGVIKPCRMTLVLGASASEEARLFSSLEGAFSKKTNKSVARVRQNDAHLGELTVRETLEISANCQGVQPKRDELVELASRKREVKILDEDAAITQIIEVLGLEDCADRKIGCSDEMTEGISRGQQRLLSLGEVLAGPSTVFLIEESSIGLDGPTSSKLVNCLRNRVNDVQGTAVISLLDPTPEIYELFDDIILFCEGQIVFQGAREFVLQFFERYGFKCPKPTRVTDFLQEVTSKKMPEKYWAGEKPYETATDFAREFQRSHAAGEGLSNEISTQFDRFKSRPTSSISRAFKHCMYQNSLLMWRQSDLALKTLLSVISVSMFKIFSKAEMDDAFVVSAVLFVIAMFSSGNPEIDPILQRLLVFFKQRDLHFFPVWIYCSSICILEIRVVLGQIAIWNLIFFAMGFGSHVQMFFKWNLPLLILILMVSALQRLIASLGRSKIWATNIWSHLCSLFMILHGSAEGINPKCGLTCTVTIKDNWSWVHWLSPTMYVQHEYRVVFQDENLYWRVVGILFAVYLLFNSLDYLALRILVMPKTELTRETAGERDPKITGGSVEISSGAENTRTLPIECKNDVQDSECGKSITFEITSYAVNLPPEMKDQSLYEDRVEILKGVSGVLRPGKLMALIDVSKKGNKTLMDVLAGRITGGHLQASIRVNGRPVNQEKLSCISGYCGQTDIHSPYITVLETLQFAALCHLDPTTENIKGKIDIIMELVELASLKDEIVGSAGINGISIEQRKRLTFAVALLTTQSILLIDDPTSGLDSRAAAKVLTIIRKIANAGCTVVCTIHQPSIYICQTFDELILLQDGDQIYAGPLGQKCSELIKHFEGIDKDSKIREASDPVAWILQTSRQIRYVHHFNKSESCRKNKALIEEVSTAADSKDLSNDHYRPSFSKQCMTHLWKQSLSYWRNREYNLVRFVWSVVEALLVGILFNCHQFGKRETEQDILNATESMIIVLLYTGLRNAQTVQPVVAIERAVFYQERAPGISCSLSFAIGLVVIELLCILVQTLIQGVIVYLLIGLEGTTTKALWYWFFLFLGRLSSTYCGMILVAVTPNIKTAKIVCKAFCNLWYLFSVYMFTKPLSLSRVMSLFWFSILYFGLICIGRLAIWRRQ